MSNKSLGDRLKSSWNAFWGRDPTTKPFTMESGELTNTLKSRRSVIYKNHADVIEEMYKE